MLRTRHIPRNRTRYRMRRSIQTQTDDTHHYLIENNYTPTNPFILFQSITDKMFTKYYPGPLNNKEVKLQITYEFIKIFINWIVLFMYNFAEEESEFMSRFSQQSTVELLHSNLKSKMKNYRKIRYPFNQILINLISENYNFFNLHNDLAVEEKIYYLVQEIKERGFDDFLNLILKDKVIKEDLLSVRKYKGSSSEGGEYNSDNYEMNEEFSSFMNSTRQKLFKLLQRFIFNKELIYNPSEREVDDIIQKEENLDYEHEEGIVSEERYRRKVKYFNFCYKRIYNWGTEDYKMYDSSSYDTFFVKQTKFIHMQKVIRDFYNSIYRQIVKMITDIQKEGPEYGEYLGESRRIDMLNNPDDVNFPFAYKLIKKIFDKYSDNSIWIGRKYVEEYERIERENSNYPELVYPRENRFYAKLLFIILEECIFPHLQIYIDPYENRFIKEFVFCERLTQWANILKAQNIHLILLESLGDKSSVYKDMILKYSSFGLVNIDSDSEFYGEGYPQSNYPIGHRLSVDPEKRPMRRYVQKDIGSIVPLRSVFSLDPDKVTVSGLTSFN